ncbi:hypothetical protein FBU30_007620 [Linnemannia zychae]|nr:hypothetical protein FBU30_007620 [Linnemannia zychae]
MTAKPEDSKHFHNPQHSLHQYPQQQQHYYFPKQQHRYQYSPSSSLGKTPVYTLYPDIPQKPSVAHIPPFSPKQLLPANRHKRPQPSFSTNKTAITITMSATYNNTSQSSPQHRTDMNLGLSQQKQQTSRPDYSTLSNKGMLPSPISPSNQASMGYITANKSTTRVTKIEETPSRGRAKTVGEGQSHYDPQYYQQPLQATTATTAAIAKEQLASTLSPRSYAQPTQAHYGGPVPRPRAASASAQTHNAKNQVYGQGQHVQSHTMGQGQGQRQGTMKQSPSMGSSSFVPGSPSSLSSHSFSQQQSSRALPAKATMTLAPSKQGSASPSLPSPTLSDKPSLLTVIPSGSLALSFDLDSDLNHPYDQEKLQQQALEYQRRLQQKPPPKQGDEASDDDSDSGSVVSYRRSIHRLSMTYKGRPGVPNISLFSGNQRSNVIQHDRSASGSSDISSSQMLVKDQGDARLQQQQQQAYSSRDNTKAGYIKQESHGSASSLASIDQHSNSQRPRKEDGRPIMIRANTSQSPSSQRPRDVHIPERSSSADTLHYRSKSEGRPGQPNLAQGQNNNYHQSPNPSSLPFPNRSQLDPRPSHESQRSYQQLDPRPSNELSQSQRPQHLQVSPSSPRTGRGIGNFNSSPEQNRNGGPLSPGLSGNANYSQNPGRAGGTTGAYHHPLPISSRGPVGYGQGSGSGAGGPIKLHPAHHLPSNGYVRPEEAFGPSNPMPEKAEDYVRQGIEYHELGEISKATQFFRTAAEMGDPVGMLMYGLSVRHGWGCKANRQLAFQYLQKSAEHAVGDLKSRDSFASKAAKGELVLAIYELGICFRHGWGAEKNKKTAAYYFEIAANLGDPDAQNDLAWCYYHGVGVKKDMYKSAKYYRLAAAQGMSTMGNSWIWKDKYGGPTSPTTLDKSQYQNSLAALGSFGQS